MTRLVYDQPAACYRPFSEAEAKTLASARDILASRIAGRDLLNSWALLCDYLALHCASERIEVLRVLYLDRKNRLIADEETGRGTVDHVPVYVREVLRRALLLDACALILCHNHPSGDTTPSASDISMTNRIKEAGDTLDITLHDHVIVARNNAQEPLSMRAAGLI